MVGRQRILFDRIWVWVLRETGVSVLTWNHSRSSPNVKRNEQDETFVVLLPYLSFPETNTALQVTSFKEMFNVGFRLLTHQQITTSFGKHTMLDLPRGSLRAT